MKKISMISGLMLFNLSVGFSKDIDYSDSDVGLNYIGLDQGGKIEFTSDYFIGSNLEKSVNKYCNMLFEEKPFSRVIKKDTIFEIHSFKYLDAKDFIVKRDSSVEINFSPEDQKNGVKGIICEPHVSVKKLVTEFDNAFKVFAPEPINFKSAIKVPKNSDIKAEEVVQRLPQACVYIGLWREKDQLSNLSQNAKDYLATFIPILRGTFKSLNNIDCESIPKEKLVEAAIKLSEDKNINDNSRNNTKAKKTSNNKAKGHSSKNM